MNHIRIGRPHLVAAPTDAPASPASAALTAVMVPSARTFTRTSAKMAAHASKYDGKYY